MAADHPERLEHHQTLALKTKGIERALLVACYRGEEEKRALPEHLQELELLAETYGLETVAKLSCPLRRVVAATFLGSGKLEEILEEAASSLADVIIFDEEISPAQQRNLEKFFGCKVMDRTELILGVFEQRAHSKESKLQVELAQTRYQYPRLKNLWSHLSRQAGTGGAGVYLKGMGEKQIEVDRRLVKKRIEELERKIGEVEVQRQTQRGARRRSPLAVFAIVGYTNAGKSTLLNALTEADVFVEDKLFATLDTTTRKFLLEENEEALLIDTVGFIRKLPHLLVAAFKSTLEEAFEADFLLHLIDLSHPAAFEQAEASLKVLEELNVEHKPVITVLNKIDRLEDLSKVSRFRLKYPKTVVISALEGRGFDRLKELMLEEIRRLRRVVTLRIPQSDYAAVSSAIRSGKILEQEYEENDVILRAELPEESVGRLRKYLQ